MKTAPDPIYVQEFLFKQSNISQVFDLKTPPYIPAACNLLVADKKRGLLYIGHNDKITVLKPAEENNAEWKIELQLPDVISKIAINCDYNYIAIAVALKPTILIYDAHSLARNSLNLLFEITSSNKLDSYVTDIRWNPTVPIMLCTITSDCTIGSFQLRIDEENSVPKVSVLSKISNEPQALCAAWSPKGKQVAVGCKNGDIVQLKPDTLKVARTIAGPSPSIGEVISILWISNYQFCAAYLNSERHTNVLIIDAPKGEANATFTCYEDITYGFPDAEGEGSILRYYFEHVPEWGLIIAGSSTSSEIAVLGTTDGGANWNQWQLVDSGRAQLPLMRTTEIYPLGLAVDKSPTNLLPWGTDSTLPHPVPILHILGTSGQLCSFHMVNLTPNCPAINVHPTEIISAPTPSQPSTSSAEISFIMNTAVTSTPRPQKQPEMVSERPKPAPMTNIFGDSLKAAGFFQQPLVEQPLTQPKPQEEKAAPLAITKPVVPREIPAPESTKAETKLIDKEAHSSQIMEQKASIDDSIRMRAYLQEQALFEKELRSRLEPQVWECGTDEERKRLGETSAVIEQFLKDLKDTTNSLSSDIAYLKALLLQSFAWVEETKSKNAATADINSRNCSDNSKIAELQRCYYYTQTQLNQVSKILDLEWSEHKAQERSRMKIPSLEYVYQNLLVHNKIIAKEKEKLEQISRKWKSLNRSSCTTVSDSSSLDRSMTNLHLNSHEKSTVRKTDIIDARCKTIASRTLSFTLEKQIKLKALLSESSPRIIKPVNPSPIQDRLKATLSSLASLSSAVTEAKTKTESSIVKQSTIVKQQPAVEKQIKAQSPLASLNSIVARIGSSDTNSIVTQNKTQQKPLPVTVSFSPAPVKQTDKKIIQQTAPTVPQSKPKQDLNINFPSSITFGTPALKPQDFPKASLADATVRNKESMINDSISKVPESALSSTGMLKDVLLSTEYPLTETARRGIISHNLPSLLTAPAVKTEAAAAATFSFATPNVVPSVAKNSSSGNALDTPTLSFGYSKSPSNTTVEPSVTAVQAPMQTPIDLSALSMTLQPTNHSSNNVNGKVNTIATSMSFAALSPAVTTQAPTMTAVSPVTTIGGLTISLVDPNIIQRKSEMPSVGPVTIEKITTSEAKTLNFGSIVAQVPSASLSTTPIFGGQAIIKNTVPEVTTTTLPATTTFGAVGFPSITPSFGTSTPASSTASVFGGFTSNTSAGITVISSPVTSVSSSTPSPFQSPLSKPTFGETTSASVPATNYGISSTTSAGTISFGISTIMTTTTTTTGTAAASITPAFSKSSPIASPVSNAQFPSAQISTSSATNVFAKPIINPASTPFGNTASSVFSNVPASTSSSTSMFGGNSMNSIFGATPLSPPSGNIFGGNTAGFGASPTSSGSIFDTGTPKSGIMFGGAANASPSTPFGSATSNASPMAGTSAASNVFRSTMPNTSPIQQPVLGSNQPAFGQASAFGAKPVFGSSPIFGASKPVFGSSFGGAPSFGESPSIGFGSPPPMQGSTIENMPKLFAEVAGSSTFESLANQSGGLSFGSLAQKSPEPEKPAYTAGSSFSSWR